MRSGVGLDHTQRHTRGFRRLHMQSCERHGYGKAERALYKKQEGHIMADISPFEK